MSDKTTVLPLVLFAVTEWTVPENRVVQLALLNRSQCHIDQKIINYEFTKLKKQIWQGTVGLGIARLSLDGKSKHAMIGLGKEKELEALLEGETEAEQTFSAYMGMTPSTNVTKPGGEEPGTGYVDQ